MGHRGTMVARECDGNTLKCVCDHAETAMVRNDFGLPIIFIKAVVCLEMSVTNFYSSALYKFKMIYLCFHDDLNLTYYAYINDNSSQVGELKSFLKFKFYCP